jgi:hypothetical protein
MEKSVTLQLPKSLYAELESLASDEQADMVEMLTRWAKLARQRRTWLQGWQDLQELIRQEGGLQVGATREEVVEQMRKTRREIFEAEYAHLYR